MVRTHGDHQQNGDAAQGVDPRVALRSWHAKQQNVQNLCGCGIPIAPDELAIF
ncbi:MAG: DUF1581 domain-containing protein [Rhodocyclales bacterium]|nr:DUF1581 domain-containing protein [Rhodocyclales bacterium]MBH1975877.1 DUF1581 domain-containing protein [Rhodocyclales bacterium]